jgi:transcriptional regulator with XRE-family HTH domain
MDITLPGLRQVREQQVLSQADVAARANVAVETISRIENGRSVRPGTARKLATALGVSVDDLRVARAETAV